MSSFPMARWIRVAGVTKLASLASAPYSHDRLRPDGPSKVPLLQRRLRPGFWPGALAVFRGGRGFAYEVQNTVAILVENRRSGDRASYASAHAILPLTMSVLCAHVAPLMQRDESRGINMEISPKKQKRPQCASTTLKGRSNENAFLTRVGFSHGTRTISGDEAPMTAAHEPCRRRMMSYWRLCQRACYPVALFAWNQPFRGEESQVPTVDV